MIVISLMLKKTVFILGLILLISCSKQSDSTLPNALTGTWTMTYQSSNSAIYKSEKQRALITYLFTPKPDSIKITFDNNGNYTFKNFNLPLEKGTYIIVQDSLLVVKPRTADFIKLNYSLPISAPGTPIIAAYSPYINFRFSTDTIHFETYTNNIIFSGTWLSKEHQPMPLNDTMLINRSYSYFTKSK